MTQRGLEGVAARPSLRDISLAVLGYAGFLAWFTWPLLASWEVALPLTAKACGFDSQLLGWALSHQSEVILGSGVGFFDGGAFHPDQRSLLYGEAAFGALPLFFPAYVLSGNPTLALNFVFLGSLLFTFVSVHLVVQWLTGRAGAGLVAVSVLAGTRWLLWEWAPCAPNYALVGWLPWIFFLLARGIATNRRMIALGALLAMQGLATVYLAVATWLVVSAVATARLLRGVSRREGVRIFAALLLAALPLLAAFLPYVVTRAANPELSDQSIWKGTMQLTRLPWGPLDARVPAGVPLGTLFLLACSGILAAWDRLSGRSQSPAGAPSASSWSLALAWIGVGILVSATPFARFGTEVVRMPHAVLADWFDAYAVIRAPHRLGVIALFGFSIAAGLAFASLLSRWQVRSLVAGVLAILVSGVLVFEGMTSSGLDRYARPLRLPSTYPLLPVAHAGEESVAALAAGAGPVLELPVPLNRRGRTAPAPQVRAMYRSIFHGRPVLNGYSGYWPAGFERRLALARQLPDAAALDSLVAETGLRAVVVHLSRLPAAARARWQGSSPAENGLALVAQHDGTLVFEVVRDSEDLVR